jgi:tetratricopeptide (TPR) repeat protein
VTCAALVLLAVVYARFRPVVETPAAQAEPTVWREKIIDERPKLLAELDLPEEYLGDEAEPGCAPPAPEAKEPPQAVVPEPRRQTAPTPHQPPKPQARSARPALRAAAYDEDEDAGDEADARPAKAAPLPRRPAPAAPRQVPNPTAQAPSAIAPGFRPPPTTWSLPASQFAYNAPQRVTATPVAPVMAASPQPAPDATADLLRQATESERAGKLDQAAALYRLVLEKQPNREGVSVRLGNLLHRQSRFDEAAEVFRQALAQKRSAVLHNNLGSVYLAQKRLEEARQEFSAAAALDPKYADPHYNLACYHALAGRPEAGLAELEQAKDIDPQVMESAAGDADLAPLRALPEYKRLTE